uniref:Glycine-rich protein n=1 Tax=Globodera rostochiensis TaxID=31243 RepID=A0A914IDU5_GLORO
MMMTTDRTRARARANGGSDDDDDDDYQTAENDNKCPDQQQARLVELLEQIAKTAQKPSIVRSENYPAFFLAMLIKTLLTVLLLLAVHVGLSTVEARWGYPGGGWGGYPRWGGGGWGGGYPRWGGGGWGGGYPRWGGGGWGGYPRWGGRRWA